MGLLLVLSTREGIASAVEAKDMRQQQGNFVEIEKSKIRSGASQNRSGNEQYNPCSALRSSYIFRRGRTALSVARMI